METREYIAYLEFLERHATDMIRITKQGDDCLRSVNLEVNKLIARLAEDPNTEKELLDTLDQLKVNYDENRPLRRNWTPYFLIYGFLSFFPGCVAVWAMERQRASERMKLLEGFRTDIGRLRKSIEGVETNIVGPAQRLPSGRDSGTSGLFMRLAIFVIIIAIIFALLMMGE